MSQWQRCRAPSGFSLVELMLSLSLGLGLSGLMLQALMAEGQNGARFSRLLGGRAAQPGPGRPGARRVPAIPPRRPYAPSGLASDAPGRCAMTPRAASDCEALTAFMKVS